MNVIDTELYINISQSIRDQVLYFDIYKIELKNTHIFGEYEKFIEKEIDEVLKGIIKALNYEFKDKGIKIPTVKGVTYTDLEEEIWWEYMRIGATPKFNFT